MMLVLTSQKMEGVSKLAVESRLQCFPQTRAGNTMAQVRKGQVVRRPYEVE